MAAPTAKGSVPEDTKQSGSGKREDYLKWEEYFMSLAFLSGKRSKDPNRQVGACIVNDQKRIIGLGYNGMPDRVSDDDMPWAHGSENEDELKTKTPYVCHAELNAVMNKIQADSRGCTMYVSLFPCNQCAKIIIQAGIRDVVYYSDEKAGKKETQAAKVLFDKAGVDYWRYDKDNKGLRTTVEIEFK